MQEKTPLVESVYVVVRREAVRLQILKPATSSEENTSLEEVGIGLTVRNRPPEQGRDGVAQKLPDDVHHNETRKTKATSTLLIME